MDTSEIERVARGLSPRQREMVSGRYDPEFASIDEAAALINLGLWAWDPAKRDPESEFDNLGVTDLGAAVRDHLNSGGGRE